MLVDTHCHLDFDRFDEDRDAMLERAVAAGVTKMIIPSVNLEKIPDILKLAEEHQWLYVAVGIHPNSTADLPNGWIDQIADYAEHYKVIAIGEIGLDYYWDDSPPEKQKIAFRTQLELAYDFDLPVIIHNRDASADVIDMLKAAPQHTEEMEKPGVLHSFLADRATADAALEMGYFLGFTGPVTYPKNEDLRDIVRNVPIDRILIETDAPFLSPQKKRGKRNEPAHVQYIAQYIARLRELDYETFANISTENAACLFGGDVIYR